MEISLDNIWIWILELKELKLERHQTIPTPQQKRPTNNGFCNNRKHEKVANRREGSCLAKQYNLPSGEHVNKLRICVPGALYIILRTRKKNNILNKTEPYQCTVSLWAGRIYGRFCNVTHLDNFGGRNCHSQISCDPKWPTRSLSKDVLSNSIDRKWGFFYWRHKIRIAKGLYSFKGRFARKCGKTTAQECKKIYLRLTFFNQKRLCFQLYQETTETLRC